MSEPGVTGQAASIPGAAPARAGLWSRLPGPIGRKLRGMFSGDGLSAKAARGSVWTAGGFGLGQVIRLGSNAVLAGLLVPEVFGVMLVVNTFITGLQMFSDMGIGSAVVQRSNKTLAGAGENSGGDAGFLNTAWTLQVLRGGVLALLAAALGPILAAAYKMPELTWLMGLTAVATAVQGFESIGRHLASRELRTDRVVIVQVGAQVVAAVVGVGLAWAMRSVTALALAQVASAVATVVLSHALGLRHAHKLTIVPGEVMGLLRFGGWLTLNTMVAFLAMSFDKFALPRMIDTATLGVYAQAGALALMPMVLTQTVASGSLFPALARVANERPEAFAAALSAGRRKVMLVTTGVVAATVVAGWPVFGLLYGESYAAAPWMIAALAPFVWLGANQFALSRALLSRREGRLLFLNATVRLAWTAAGGLIAWMLSRDVLVFCLGLSVGPLVSIAVAHVCLRSLKVDDVKREFSLTGIAAVAIACAVGIGWGVGNLLEHWIS